MSFDFSQGTAVTPNAPSNGGGFDFSAGTPGGAPSDRVAGVIQQNQPVADNQPSLGDALVSGFKNTFANVKGAINGTSADSQGENPLVRGLQATAAGFHGITDAIGTVATHAYNAIPQSVKDTAASTAESTIPGGQLLSHVLGSVIPKEVSLAGQAAQQVGESQPVQKISQAIYNWQQAHPEASANLDSVLKALSATGQISGDVAGADLGAGAIEKAAPVVTDAAKAAVEQAPAAIDAAKAFVTPDPAVVAAKQSQTAIDAVNPDLSGKALVGAYKDVVTGARDVTPGGLFTEQSLSPSQRAIQTGTRLSSDIPLTATLEDGTKDTIPALQLTKDPVKNLNVLADGLTNTETKLNTALQGDPEINMNAQKPALQSSLENLKAGAPREFTAIKDNKAVYDNVINFGQEQVASASDTVQGLRDARISFDSHAQKEYPSAFKNGTIDTSTPAGRAIKGVRDTINEHLYNTAPNGSDIQALIGREADIFNARDTVAMKAAANDGANWFTKFANANPKSAAVLKYGIPAFAGDKIIKSATGIGF